jgi:hypothetical protein
MSKFTKMLSIGKDILEGKKSDSVDCNIIEEYDLERLSNTIQWLEKLCDQQNIYYSLGQSKRDLGLVDILVQDENGNGVLSQVKLFPLKQGKSNQSHDFLDSEVNFIREITDWNGRLNRQLPIGEYYVELSKGSEYEISSAHIQVHLDKTAQLTQVLVPIINLRNENWYAGDLHHHSIYSSPVYGGTDPVVESPALVAQSMVAMGASYGALSDHHNTFNHKKWAAVESNNFLPILSKEISTSNGHVMALGVEKDIIYRIPENENRTDTYLRNEFIRVTDEIKKLGGLPQINHPRDKSKSISWNEKYEDMIQIFETIEIWNGSNPMLKGTTNYEAFLLWKKLLEEGRFIPATTGSDTHNIMANDYHEYINRLRWLADLIIKDQLLLPDEFKDEMTSLIHIARKHLPILMKWIEGLTSACVRTYVHVEGEFTQENVLNSLKKGHSFLTNGPILIPDINGKHPGDTVEKTTDKINISLKLIANKPLKKVSIYTNGDKRMEFQLEAMDALQGKYDYSRILPDMEICDVKWMFFIAEDDCTNMAITNPIFFE